LKAEVLHWQCLVDRGAYVVTADELKIMKANENEMAEVPHQQIVVACISKQRLFKNTLSPTPANTLLFAGSHLYPSNVEVLLGDESGSFVYVYYTKTYSKVIITNHLRDMTIDGITAIFSGKEYIYKVTVEAVEGYTNNDQWEDIKRTIASFRFIK
jgi:hypothetical protein